MKGLSILAAFLGGAAVGAACGILFAPEKGVDTRERIADAIRKNGKTLSTMGEAAKKFIANWESEKYRKSLAGKK